MYMSTACIHKYCIHTQIIVMTLLQGEKEEGDGGDKVWGDGTWDEASLPLMTKAGQEFWPGAGAWEGSERERPATTAVLAG